METRTYDPKNRLKGLVRGALQPTFRYDPLNYRIDKTIAPGDARHYYLEGEHLEMVTDLNNSVLGKYLRGAVIDEIVNGYERPLATDDYAVWSWQHDAVGSVTQLVGHEGTVESTQRYLPFGEKTLSPPLTSFFGYTGRDEESENGTYYYRARYYDPSLGRFLSEDPIGFHGGINFYAYVGNNPLVANDPMGLYVGVDDAMFTLGGGLVGVAGQGAADLITGSPSSFNAYVAAFAGGAVAGEVLLYTGPVAGPFAAGAAGAAASSVVRQNLDVYTGRQDQISYGSMLFETSLGTATGFIPGARVAGVTMGRNSYNAIFRQITTKAESGTISSVAPQTAAKMFVGRSVDTSLFPGSVAAPLASSLGSSVWDSLFDPRPLYASSSNPRTTMPAYYCVRR